MRVGDDWPDVAGERTASLLTAKPLRHVPAIVRTALAGPTLEVYLLVRRLPQRPHIPIPCRPVEAEAPGIAHPVGPDLLARRGAGGEGIVWWDRLRRARSGLFHVNAQESFPSRVSMRWPNALGDPRPPSPTPTERSPSRPNTSIPLLCSCPGCLMTSIVWALVRFACS